MLYLHQTDLVNNWQGVIIYPQRQIEFGEVSRYQELLNSGRVSRFYLNELNTNDSVGLAILKLIIASKKRAIEQGKRLVQQVRQKFPQAKQQQELLQLIETILIYKLPNISRQELEAMFSLNDLKQTKVFQEGREEGKIVAKLESIPRLVVLGLSLEQIAQALDLEIEQVRQAIQQNQDQSS